MNEHLLTGMDAQNPLALLAALGLLRVLEEVREDEEARPRLAFRDEGRPVPVLHSERSLAEIYKTVLKDAKSKAGQVALGLAYDAEGKLTEPDAKGAVTDLRPDPEKGARPFLEQLVKKRVDRRSVDLAASFFSELVADNSGKTKPTALYFTSGQQKFLTMVKELREGLTQEHLEEALLGPWRSEAPLPSMSWDSTMSRQYALRATDPSGEKRGSVAGANWLAVIGLVFFPVQRQRGQLVTAGVRGGWEGALAWPVWSAPCTCAEVACLLRGNARELTLAQRQALGIWQVYEAQINRFGQGYGSFSPAAVVNPRKEREAAKV